MGPFRVYGALNTTEVYFNTYVPDQHDSSIHIQAVYTVTTKTDFMRIVAT